MKTKILMTLCTLFLLLGGMGCDDKEEVEKINYPESKIITDLHFASLLAEGLITDNGFRVIRSKEVLAKHYIGTPEIVDTIDFDKYSLILGTLVDSRLPVDVSCQFTKESINSYKLKVYATFYGKGVADAPPKYFLTFGIVVNKLHYISQVNLGAVEINIPMPEFLPNIWKYKGFGNTETGTINKIEEENCTDCYKLELKEEGNCKLYLPNNNELEGLFKVIDSDFSFTDIRFVTPTTNETEITKQFTEKLKSVKSYKISDKQELLLYYSDTEYLIFQK